MTALGPFALVKGIANHITIKRAETCNRVEMFWNGTTRVNTNLLGSRTQSLKLTTITVAQLDSF